MSPSIEIEVLADMLGVAAIAMATIGMLWLPVIV